jgi:predicted RNA-binding Zn-ribbon protein involved in translation (DUF1610 family)
MAQVKCPNCSRQFVRRVAAVRSAERLLGILSVYPFKCQLCGFRFRSPQWGGGNVRVAEDRREYDRMPASFPLTFQAINLSGKGLATNISMGGCCFDTSTPLAGGIVLRLELQLSDNVSPVVVDAAAVRHSQGQSVGVEFLQWQESERARLQLFVRGLLISRAA